MVRESAKGRQIRLMFQDEGRFGLLGDPRRCWAPKGVRPVVRKRQLRQYTYAFAAVSPHDGVMDSLVLPWVNAEMMSLFLRTVADRHSDEFIVMVMDQAGWHIADALHVPKNMQIEFLPPYSPELNPAEHLWDDLREKDFANRAFSSMSVVEEALVRGLRRQEQNPVAMQRLTGFNWITSISLNAN